MGYGTEVEKGVRGCGSWGVVVWKWFEGKRGGLVD